MVNSARAGNRRYLPSSPFSVHGRNKLSMELDLKRDRAVALQLLERADVVVDFAPRKVRILTPFARMVKL